MIRAFTSAFASAAILGASALDLNGRTYTRTVRPLAEGAELISVGIRGIKPAEARMARFDLARNPRLLMQFRYGPVDGRKRSTPEQMARDAESEFGGTALAAINGDFFLYEKGETPAKPFGITYERGKMHERGCWDPQGYDVVAALEDGGYAIGKLSVEAKGAVTNVLCDGRSVTSAIRVWNRPLSGGKIHLPSEMNCYPKDDAQKFYPRTFVGLGTNLVVFLVADGRQPFWSMGLTSAEAVELMRREGCTEAGQFDGGGSTAMWTRDGYANKPSDMSGARAVANGLVMSMTSAATSATTLATPSLVEGFSKPPQENRPHVWWWFDNDAPKESIVRDIRAMKRAGLAGFHFRKYVDDPKTFKFAVHEAAAQGLEVVTMVGAGGCGRPGVPPELCQKELLFTSVDVKGGSAIRQKLKRGAIKSKTWNEKGFPKGLFTDIRTYAVPKRKGVSLDEVRDVTAFLEAAKDLLVWPEAPAGEWTILRFGWAPKQIGWSGLGIDHLSRAAVDDHWAHAVTPYLAALDSEERKAFKGVLCDSWEVGIAGWTVGFEEEFAKRRGYEIWRFLPILSGIDFCEKEASERFRRDYDLTVEDLIVDNHYRRKQELARRDGIVSVAEACGPHQHLGDVRRMQGASDVAMGEAWMPCGSKPGETQRFLVRDAATAAHVYGIPEVLCETFTTIKTYWTEGLSDLKPCADRAFCDGMTRVCWHGMQHSASLTDKPGTVRDIGPHYTPQTTWFNESRAFNDYLARCSWMLSQGRFVADCLLYAGDAKGIFVGHKTPAHALGEGYDYDMCPTEVLLASHVENGEIVLGSGMRYKALAISDISPEYQAEVEGTVKKAREYAPFSPRIPEVARTKLAALKKAGAVILKTRAERERFASGDAVEPDFTAGGRGVGEIDWIHRTTRDAEIYFVVNRTRRETRFTASFRQSSDKVALWDAVTGLRHPADAKRVGGRTEVALELAAFGSVFVVFGLPASGMEDVLPLKAKGTSVGGPWKVSFDSAWGGPKEPVTMEKLTDWIEIDDPGVRYYSGTATYRSKALVVPSKGRCWLDLGRLGRGNVAEVFDGKKSLGVVWTAPYRIEVTGAKDLSVRVTNLWPNRLIYDASLPPEKRLTKTNVKPFKPTDKPLHSGLLGPVRILR